MKAAIKQIIIILIAAILLFGGLGIFLRMEIMNGLMLIPIVMMGIGGGLLAYILKKEVR